MTAAQNITQCGHDESETLKKKKKKRGILLEILDLVSKHDASVKRPRSWRPRNTKYTSKNTQNELLFPRNVERGNHKRNY